MWYLEVSQIRDIPAGDKFAHLGVSVFGDPVQYLFEASISVRDALDGIC